MKGGMKERAVEAALAIAVAVAVAVAIAASAEVHACAGVVDGKGPCPARWYWRRLCV